MSKVAKTMITVACFLGTAAFAQSENACSSGNYSIVQSADGATLSILFDGFVLQAGGESDVKSVRKFCILHIPLKLPANTSVGVYRVDYRGYAMLNAKQSSELSVEYHLGPRNKGRTFHRRIKGDYDGDFIFQETLGAGLMKRVGCGETASLDVSIAMNLQTNEQNSEALASLDTIDGAPQGGLVYHLNYKKCH